MNEIPHPGFDKPEKYETFTTTNNLEELEKEIATWIPQYIRGGEKGIKKAEQKANERWPIHPWTILPKEGEHGEITNFDKWLEDYRLWIYSFSGNRGYEEGYEQAEKDTIERVCEWLSRNYDIDLARFRKEMVVIND